MLQRPSENFPENPNLAKCIALIEKFRARTFLVLRQNPQRLEPGWQIYNVDSVNQRICLILEIDHDPSKSRVATVPYRQFCSWQNDPGVSQAFGLDHTKIPPFRIENPRDSQIEIPPVVLDIQD